MEKGSGKRHQFMSTVTPLVVRMGTLTVRAAVSTIFVAVAIAAILTGSFAASPSANAADDSCPAVEVVFARGTFEAPGVGATGQAFVDALNARLPGKTVDVYGWPIPPRWSSVGLPRESPTPATRLRR
jgi:cutinase